MSRQVVASSVEGVRVLLERRRAALARPIVAGVSGYCGAGKSTLVRSIVGDAPSFVRMRGDDFLDPTRSHQRSVDWDGVERLRLVEEVLVPFQSRSESTFRRFDWNLRELGVPEPVPAGEILLVDLIGLLHPDAMDALDMSIWVDVPQQTAPRRGMRRDEELDRDHSRLWLDVWMPNDSDFDQYYAPRERAEVLYRG